MRLCGNLDNVGEEIAALERQIFDYEIHFIVGIFDARNGDVANLFDESRDNNVTDILPQLQQSQYTITR